MGRDFVCSILAVLFIAVHSSMAFPSNIHENMTRAERFAVFGSEDSVPEYEVFPLPLSGARSRRKADENIALEVKVNGRKIKLDLKPTTYLATKYTPVWYAESDKNAYNKIRYDPLMTALSDIGEFKMYHDVKNEAHIVGYDNRKNGINIEGFVGNSWIRTVSKRLTRELRTNKSHLVNTSAWNNRSIISDPEDGKGYGAVFNIPNALKDVKSLVDAENLGREKRARHKAGKRKVSKAVYPKILIVVLKTAMRRNYISATLRTVLKFWNGVAMMFRALHEPKIYLNIAGILIAGDVWVTPLSFQNEVDDRDVFVERALSEIGKTFYKERVRFPMNRYDMIITMTTLKLLPKGDTSIRVKGLLGYNNPNAHACSSTREASQKKIIESTGIVSYKNTPIGIRTAAKIIAHLLGVKDDMSNATNPDCNSEKGYIMAEFSNTTKQKMQWSECSRRDFSRYFASKKSSCLKNEPLWIKQVGKVLPGRWLSLDGQCQNEGYAKACKVKKELICRAKTCQAKKSRKCGRSKLRPLPGSKCGTNTVGFKLCVKKRSFYTDGLIL